MSWTKQLLVGLAQLLDDGDAGTWRDAGTYAADETAISYRGVPSTPDRLITLSLYPVEDTPGIADVTVGVQVRVRGTVDPTVGDDIGDDVYELLHGASGLTLGGVAVVQIYRQSHAPLGQDANGRWEYSHNYYVDAMRPTAFNTD